MKLIGYAAHNLTLNTSASKTVRLKNVNNEVLRKLTTENLTSLRKIIEWNIDHDIYFYRISSNLIPFASHHVNKIDWPKEFQKYFTKIGKLISDNQIIVSMHPGQYTVLSSPDNAVTKRAIAEIEYHNTVLDLLNTSFNAKIIIHLGGKY
jgi:UV DNA damage endonuclease